MPKPEDNRGWWDDTKIPKKPAKKLPDDYIINDWLKNHRPEQPAQVPLDQEITNLPSAPQHDIDDNKPVPEPN